MRFVVILCCLATAYAANVGYEYKRQFGAPLIGFVGNQHLLLDSISGNDFSAPASVPASVPVSVPASVYSSVPASAPASAPVSIPTTVEFEKEFFSFSAPENVFDDNNGGHQPFNSLKRALRVIFIKNPENAGIENAALQLAKSISNQHTAIYVLHKQADIGDLTNKLNALNKNNANKPEVHFVKYRTPADAENAQRTIQAQYDSLGGKSSSYNGGVAPVLDFASEGPLSGNAINNGLQSVEPSDNYLPVKKRA